MEIHYITDGSVGACSVRRTDSVLFWNILYDAIRNHGVFDWQSCYFWKCLGCSNFLYGRIPQSQIVQLMWLVDFWISVGARRGQVYLCELAAKGMLLFFILSKSSVGNRYDGVDLTHFVIIFMVDLSWESAIWNTGAQYSSARNICSRLKYGVFSVSIR